MNITFIKIFLKKRKKESSKGFTLLEVLIVISIITILAGFLIPKFMGYENKAKDVKAKNTGKQIYNAVMYTYSDKGNSLVDNDIKASVSELTGIDVSATGNVTKTANGYNIKYNSDSKKYVVSINFGDESYSVNESPD